MKNTLFVALLFALCVFAFAGCGGGDSKTSAVQTTTTTTMGQELIDLDKAYKDGIITEKQYNQQKQKILNQSN